MDKGMSDVLVNVVVVVVKFGHGDDRRGSER